MAATLDKTIGAYHDSSNARLRKIGGYTGPVSYVNPGGDVFAPGDLGMSRIELVLFTPATNGTLFVYPVWVPNPTTGGGAVKWLVGTTGVEVANGVNLSAYTARFEAIGK
jgi:hypothetical protein